MSFGSLKEALESTHDAGRYDYHFVRLFTGTWVRVEGAPVGIRVKKIRQNIWHQVV
jgi:hypothetical protein